MPPPGVCLNILEARHKQDGFGSLANPEKFLNQDFKQLQQYCLIKGLRYIDDMFPPDSTAIGSGILNPSDLAKVEWLRPAKIATNPSFVLDGVSRFDFGQGILGNCWFLASIGALTFQNHILGQVVPLEQEFNEEYCGLFHFRFWRFGKWVDVVIDDKLPTINGSLIFVHSKDENEFWPALMEKAYAKVCGSYTDMTSGTPSEAMMDFTGGVHMCMQLSDPPQNLWEMMCRSGNFSTLMSCGTPQGETSDNTVLPNGLVQGHAYTVTGVKQVMSQGKPVKLVRLWNPWGKGEWTGNWSDRSSLWKTVSPQDREQCLSVDDDGEFWMTLADFCKFYSDLDICCQCPNFLDGSSCQWKTSLYEGRWVAGTTAGGCANNKNTFWTNPQFRIKINANNFEKDGEKNVLVSLMQKPDKRNRRLVQNLHIGFSIFEVTEKYQAQRGKFPATFFSSHAPVVQTKTYMNARDVMEFFMLKPGEYLIVPSTFNANETASFILTILSKSETHIHESSEGHDHDHGEGEEHEPSEGDVEKASNRRTLFRQFSSKYEEMNAEQLLELLNAEILQGNLKSGGFTIDACRSMVALMDTSITGKLNSKEFLILWDKIVTYKDIFYGADTSKSGTLSQSELRNAVMATGKRTSDHMLNLMALRFCSSFGEITLESFICLIIRFECMKGIFKKLSDGMTVTLRESEWMYLTMYS